LLWHTWLRFLDKIIKEPVTLFQKHHVHEREREKCVLILVLKKVYKLLFLLKTSMSQSPHFRNIMSMMGREKNVFTVCIS
jgi:hypothetical protein